MGREKVFFVHLWHVVYLEHHQESIKTPAEQKREFKKEAGYILKQRNLFLLLSNENQNALKTVSCTAMLKNLKSNKIHKNFLQNTTKYRQYKSNLYIKIHTEIHKWRDVSCSWGWQLPSNWPTHSMRYLTGPQHHQNCRDCVPFPDLQPLQKT